MGIKENKAFMAFLGSLFVILLLLAILIFRKPKVIIQGPDITKQLRDSITLLTGQIEEERAYAVRSKEITDSLEALPPKIKIIYVDQKNFTKSATTKQLDSIARANAGLPPR